MKHFLLIIFSFIFTQWVVAQTEKIKFEKLKHDFGTIYKGEKTDITFEFSNVSSEAVQLHNVKASCGCTTPNWSKEPVAPGAKGYVSASYDSHRVGQFNKSITVIYDTSGIIQPVVLTISGNVLDTTEEGNHNHPSKPIVNYNFPQGNLSFEKVTEEIGIIDTDKKHEVIFKLKNMGKETIRVFEEPQADLFFTMVRAFPNYIQPGQEATLMVSMDAAKYDKPGKFSKKVLVKTSDIAGETKELTVSGEFNKVMTAEEKAQAPNIEFDNTEYDAGTVIEGEKVVHKYVFRNTGKSDLVIEYAKGSCGCTVAEPKEKVIPAGGSSEITATFDSQGRFGENKKSISVKSNDPDNEMVTLQLKVKVDKDPFHAGDTGPVEKLK